QSAEPGGQVPGGGGGHSAVRGAAAVALCCRRLQRLRIKSKKRKNAKKGNSNGQKRRKSRMYDPLQQQQQLFGGCLCLFSVESKTNEELIEMLREVDSARAQQLHPNDRRRIIRSIQVSKQFGMPHSELMRAHKSQQLRYDACILWLDVRDREVLENRLRRRLLEMCKKGLLEEVKWLAKELNLQSWPPEPPGAPEGTPKGGPQEAPQESPRGAPSGGPHRGPQGDSQGGSRGGPGGPQGPLSESEEDVNLPTERKKLEGFRGGVLQGIGYKEFLPLVLPGGPQGSPQGGPQRAPEGAPQGVPQGSLNPGENEKEEINESLKKCLDLVVLRSLQYSKQQRKWIRNKFLIRRRNLPLYFLEATDGFMSGEPFCEDSEFAAAAQMSGAVRLRDLEGAEENK
ncbi:tRNA delta(2)-isopentenylpyrophosphate transferase, putative, partial [Eimeria tenella]